MASLQMFCHPSLSSPDMSFSHEDYRRPISILSAKKTPKTVTLAVSQDAPSQPIPAKPEIELEFIGPKPGGDGSYPVDKASAVSGDKLLRNIMLDNKLELYATSCTLKILRKSGLYIYSLSQGKLMNCGGGGSCGTCIVEIIDGKDLLNERTNTELRYLKKKPESWRLACQTIVGNKENSGKVVVQRLPQWKK